MNNNMEKHNLKIAGVVVLYNPDDTVLENIKSYINQVEKLYIYDNSDVKNTALIEALNRTGHCHYISFSKNEGIAKALNYSAELAISEGYDFLLTMDQDSIVPDRMIVRMLDSVGEYVNIAIISPVHCNRYHTEKYSNSETEDILVAFTSGNLVNLNAFEKIGKFKEEYFIDYVDIEYCLRIHEYKYRVVQVNNAKLIHNEGNLNQENFFGRIVYTYNHAPLRWYYKSRNFFYMTKEYKKKFPEFFQRENKLHLNSIIKIILYENEKLEKLKWIVKGVYDFEKGLTGSFIKSDPRKR